MVHGDFVSSNLADEAVHEITAPPTRASIADGINIVWSGETTLMEFDNNSSVIAETKFGSGIDAMSVAEAFNREPLIQMIQKFSDAWKAWTHHPGKYGAKLHTFQRPLAAGDFRRPENIVWAAPSEGDDTIVHNTFCLPYIRFYNSNWEVRIYGVDLVLQAIAWDDKKAIQQAVNTLKDVDYWKSVAALLNPMKWQRALATEANHRRRKEALAILAQEDDAAHAAFSYPSRSVSTRKLAKLVRQHIRENPEEGRLLRSVVMEHCDLNIPGKGPTRVAECLDIHWNVNTTLTSRRSLALKLDEFLAPYGYSVILTKKGRIILSREKALTKTHLASILRHRKETPYVIIH